MRRNQISIHFELDYLDNVVNTENSCIEIEEHTHHLALHPFHLNNVKESIKDILNKDIAKFVKNLNGILLGYKNLKLVSDVGTIVYDSCFIHVDILASFYMFKPQVGKVLFGLVNKKSEDHIGCLVHNTFNVSLPRPEGNDDDNNEWLGLQAEIGSEILCKITFIDLEARLPYIRAELTSILKNGPVGDLHGIESTSHETKVKPNKIIFESDNEEEVDSSNNIKKIKKDNKTISEHFKEDVEKEEKTKKRKRKHSERESDDFEVIKKKKKHKCKIETEELENGNDSIIKKKKLNKDDEEFESINSISLKNIKIKKEVLDDSLEELTNAALQRALLRVSYDEVKKEKQKSKKLKTDLSKNEDSDVLFSELNLDSLLESSHSSVDDNFLMADDEDKKIKKRRKSLSVLPDNVLEHELLRDSDLERLCTDVYYGKTKKKKDKKK